MDSHSHDQQKPKKKKKDTTLDLNLVLKNMNHPSITFMKNYQEVYLKNERANYNNERILLCSK